MKKRGRVQGKDERPDIYRFGELMKAYNELGTERIDGSIPVSRIREYLDRHCLPDYWEAVFIRVDREHAKLEADDGTDRNSTTSH